jgi:hypothetical protein
MSFETGFEFPYDNVPANSTAFSSVSRYIYGVGLGRVVRKVRQHPDDHKFEFQHSSEFTFRSDLLLTARGGST